MRAGSSFERAAALSAECRDRGVTAQATLLAVAIEAMWRGSDGAHLTNPQIAEGTGQSLTTVKRQVRSLCEAGIWARGAGHRINFAWSAAQDADRAVGSDRPLVGSDRPLGLDTEGGQIGPLRGQSGPGSDRPQGQIGPSKGSNRSLEGVNLTPKSAVESKRASREGSARARAGEPPGSGPPSAPTEPELQADGPTAALPAGAEVCPDSEPDAERRRRMLRLVGPLATGPRPVRSPLDELADGLGLIEQAVGSAIRPDLAHAARSYQDFRSEQGWPPMRAPHWLELFDEAGRDQERFREAINHAERSGWRSVHPRTPKTRERTDGEPRNAGRRRSGGGRNALPQTGFKIPTS